MVLASFQDQGSSGLVTTGVVVLARGLSPTNTYSGCMTPPHARAISSSTGSTSITHLHSCRRAVSRPEVGPASSPLFELVQRRARTVLELQRCDRLPGGAGLWVVAPIRINHLASQPFVRVLRIGRWRQPACEDFADAMYLRSDQPASTVGFGRRRPGSLPRAKY